MRKIGGQNFITDPPHSHDLLRKIISTVEVIGTLLVDRKREGVFRRQMPAL